MKRRAIIELVDVGAAGPPGSAVLDAEIPFLGQAVRLRVAAPDGRSTLADVVPLARGMCDLLTGRLIRHVEGLGRRVSCAKGCGACCTNYLVPVTVPEAFRLMEDLRALPLAERQRLEAVFAAADEKVAASGLQEAYGKLDKSDPAAAAVQRELAGKWWSQERFACPLLDGQSCGLYPSRPIPCREFLVVSPPDLCRSNRETRIRWPFSMHRVLSRWAAELEATDPTLVLLPNLLSWSAGKTARSQRTWRRPGMIRRFLDILTDEAARGARAYAGPVPPGEEPQAHAR